MIAVLLIFFVEFSVGLPILFDAETGLTGFVLLLIVVLAESWIVVPFATIGSPSLPYYEALGV
jgi:hypothetical protein